MQVAALIGPQQVVSGSKAILVNVNRMFIVCQRLCNFVSFLARLTCTRKQRRSLMLKT